MSQDEPVDEPPPVAEAPTPPRRGLTRGRRILLGLLIVPALLSVLYTLAALHFSYSDGDRAGVLQKFSHKGWICKTWEGELAMSTVPGVAPVIWSFTVRDDHSAQQIRQAIGRRVVVHYTEHVGVPSNCFGETRYFADSVTVQP